MFNVNSIVRLWSTLYDKRKKDVVSAMKADQGAAWKQRGKRFEAFRPKHENPEPSGWYIMLYTLLRPAVLLGLDRRDDRSDPPAGTGYSTLSWTTLRQVFRRRQPKPEAPGRSDEGWVL